MKGLMVQILKPTKTELTLDVCPLSCLPGARIDEKVHMVVIDLKLWT